MKSFVFVHFINEMNLCSHHFLHRQQFSKASNHYTSYLMRYSKFCLYISPFPFSYSAELHFSLISLETTFRISLPIWYRNLQGCGQKADWMKMKWVWLHEKSDEFTTWFPMWSQVVFFSEVKFIHGTFSHKFFLDEWTLAYMHP